MVSMNVWYVEFCLIPGPRDISRAARTRARTKDLDQIHQDLQPHNATKLKNQEIDEDKPGLGQHYCIPCAKYFETNHALTEHKRGKVHKRRLRDLKHPPYTQKEAEAAAGLGTDNGKTSSMQKGGSGVYPLPPPPATTIQALAQEKPGSVA